MIEFYRYVRHSERAAYEARGWRFAADLGPVHGQWSVLMWHAEEQDCEVCRREG